MRCALYRGKVVIPCAPSPWVIVRRACHRGARLPSVVQQAQLPSQGELSHLGEILLLPAYEVFFLLNNHNKRTCESLKSPINAVCATARAIGRSFSIVC